MKLILEGDPVCQIRMKFSGRNGIGRLYDPRKKIKDMLKKTILLKFKEAPKFEHPRVSFVFHMPIPKSIPKKLLPLYNSGLLKHEKKPDSDNLIKLYLDCLDDICFEGDQKVSLGNSIKLYHPKPKTVIIIDEMTEILQQSEVDPATWLFLSEEQHGEQYSCEKDCPSDSCNQDELTRLQSFAKKLPHPIFHTLSQLLCSLETPQ